MVAEEKQITTAYVSPEEYLVRERAAFEKSEYYQGEIIPMAGATTNHNIIQRNLSGILYNALRRTSCQFFPSDMRVHVPATTLYTYPDFSLFCGQPAFIDNVFDTLLNPVALIEVLSAGTASYDRGDKFLLYRSIPSFTEYMLIDSRRLLIEVWRKEEGRWTLMQETDNPNETILLLSVNATLSIQDIYELTEGIR